MPAPELSPVITFTGELPNFLTQPPLVFAANANNSVLQWNNILQSYNVSLGTVNLALEYIDQQVGLAEDAVQGATDAGNEQVQLAAAQVTAATEQTVLAQGYAGDAQNYAGIAAAAANFLGTWASLGSGAVTAFSGMVFHDGSFWVPLVNLANASSVEPGTDPATWLDYIALVTGGLTKVTSPTDTTSGNVLDVAWIVSRGIGGSHDASGRTFTNPNNLAGLGLISGRCDGETIGISGLTDTDIGVLTIEAQATDASVAGTVALTFKRGSQVWVRSNTNATTWAAWSRLRGVSEVVGEAEGGTGQTTFAASLAALGGAAAGSIATSGLTMTSDRIVGRLAAGTGAPQLLTENDLKTGFDLASSGAITASGLTITNARMIGRTAGSTGAPQELSGTDVLAFLGGGVTSVSQAGAVSWVAAGAVIRLVKISGFVIACFDFNSGSTATGAASWTASIPSGYRPSSTFTGGFTGSNASAPFGDVDQCTVSVTTAGVVSTNRQSNGNGFSFSQTVIWAV